MRIYIAGPMTGLPEFNYPAFHKAAADLAALGHTPINPADSESQNATGKPQEWTWYMRHGLRALVDAEAVALLDGWEDSRGSAVEVFVANALRMEIRVLGDWLAPSDEPS
jgi:hypothetical protein